MGWGRFVNEIFLLGKFFRCCELSNFDILRFYIVVHARTLVVFLLKEEVNMNRQNIEFPEQSPWDSGFSIFKRRIGEQLQLNGFDYDSIDDTDLLKYYRSGESETFVLSAAGCF